MRDYIKKAYNSSVLILNNGREYEFYKRTDRRPTIIALPPLDEQWLNYYKNNNMKFMSEADFNELWELIKKDKKIFRML